MAKRNKEGTVLVREFSSAAEVGNPLSEQNLIGIQFASSQCRWCTCLQTVTFDLPFDFILDCFSS